MKLMGFFGAHTRAFAFKKLLEHLSDRKLSNLEVGPSDNSRNSTIMDRVKTFLQGVRRFGFVMTKFGFSGP
jgi:hypothetical protein